MINQNISIFTFVGFLGSLIIVLTASYTAWENLINRKFSKFGFDAWIFFLTRPFISRRKVDIIYKDKKRIMTFGVMMLLIAIGGLPDTITYFLEKIWPYWK